MDAIQLNKDLGYIRIGCAVPQLCVADVDYNVARIIDIIQDAKSRGVQVLSFPEMSITGYTIGDLVHQQVLLEKAKQGLGVLVEETANTQMAVIVGAPLYVDQKIFTCAAIVNNGELLGVVPKSFIPSYKEFYEDRWFSPSRDSFSKQIELAGKNVPFGTDLLFRLENVPGAVIGIEVCEDLWVPLSPHEYQALAGATILLNISASNDILGKAEWRRMIVAAESGRCIAAYCYTSAGPGESSNDVVYGGHAIIAENGVVLDESSRLSPDAQLIVSDIDLDRLAHDRRAMTSFHDIERQTKQYCTITARVQDITPEVLSRSIDPNPFVPQDPLRRAERCKDIFSMQVTALGKKLSGAKMDKLVLGVSGGLDSTLAIIVAAKTADYLNIPRKNIYTFTLPGFGTTDRTRDNATQLCRALDVSLEEVNIVDACNIHLNDLAHESDSDVVFENVQARYRTEFLFNTANRLGALLLGTGDLTEVALGWATFSGDHMSHYHVNVSVPKTLVQYLIRWVADEEINEPVAQRVLYDILDTPISPELLKPENGEIAQKSEDIIGPVELADFYLYPFIRFGIRPGKILYMAHEVNRAGLFQKRYTLDELYKWLTSFLKRFFTNQFKRTCLPEGPKVGSVSLSPRGDWRMPSDSEVTLWLEDLDAMYNRLR